MCLLRLLSSLASLAVGGPGGALEPLVAVVVAAGARLPTRLGLGAAEELPRGALGGGQHAGSLQAEVHAAGDEAEERDGHEERLGVEDAHGVEDGDGGVEEGGRVHLGGVLVKRGEGEGEVVTRQLRIEEEGVLEGGFLSGVDDGEVLGDGEVHDVERVLLGGVDGARDVGHVHGALAVVAETQKHLQGLAGGEASLGVIGEDVDGVDVVVRLGDVREEVTARGGLGGSLGGRVLGN